MYKLGEKYWKAMDDDSIDMLRVIKVNDGKLTLKVEADDSILEMEESELKDYILLRPDGYLSFCVVAMQGDFKDIVVFMNRTDDLDMSQHLPYLVCRQSIVDSFATTDEARPFIGLSITQDSCPENVPFNSILASNGVDFSINIGVYLNDSLDILMSYVKDDIDKFDSVLLYNYEGCADIGIRGASESLLDLLVDNSFMYDFRQSFGIIEINHELGYSKENMSVYGYEKAILESHIRKNMFETLVIEYDHTIERSKIERSYIMVADANNKVYIIAYNEGLHIDPVIRDMIKSKMDLVAAFKLL